MSEKEVLIYPEKVVSSENTEHDKIIEEVIAMINGYAPHSNTDMVYIAYRLAKSAHRGQKRKSGEDYIEHPVRIAHIAAELEMDVVGISAALLHDVIEDTPFTFDDIKALFGSDVADIVDGVTKLKKLQYNTREEQQVENLRKMFLAMAKDIRVVIIKLIDRLHNMRTLKYMRPDRQLAISKETLDVYAPLAHRLGMSKIKSELEDLSLKYLDPIAYEEIRESIKQKKD
ncbi:MAG: bifunctional (p)ppGpp synthetase/guanosine-3',5'-bis(diphosphate) 3'-pyrophosphohydrolase, partial [Clostridia bacterium]|nr:bifunctional (p)ppGpp synthetase/guanosine-3',5'-bis(diphosphate) 3'-pyrophosphohydrolase [Clostridia bacterium]